MNQKSIIIIGAGIAGLSAGCYGQMNGYRTQIFEMHDLPGGVCTSWKREGYTINGCIGWLTGSSPNNNYYRIWEELGAVQGRKVVNHEEFTRVVGKDGKAFIIYCDIDRLEQHMKELAPQDAKVIDEFIKAARICAKFNPPTDKAPELYGWLDGIKFLIQAWPFLQVVSTWKSVSLHDFAARFSSPFMRRVLPLVFPDTLALLTTLGWLDQKAAGYPIGGSLEFARAIERRYLDLGGEIHYRSPVAEVLVENNRAVGVRLRDGTTHRSDIVISAADGRTTIFDMLGEKYINKEIRGYYTDLALFPPLIHVALGAARSFDGLPHSVIYPLDPPITIGGHEQKSLSVETYNFDSTLAPPNKTALRIMLPSDYAYWQGLRQDLDLYKAEKKKIADTVIALLDGHYPGLADQVEMWDVATPLTWERYTGNWKGSYEGWLSTEKTMPPFRMRKTLPGLASFYMAGQWVEPGGGLPAVAGSGRNVIQIICKRDKRIFVTKVP